eukprot:TRINITY_DN16998_c0_g1_i1.p4 TRINITY_DN16998_c0_g1~~TRINITY_DN16998_c0_g1_i1.p4  ORF type:complete len:109 (+),score=40.56 TRINITY_DN16998_c0_g1_i1:428-754(+)
MAAELDRREKMHERQQNVGRAKRPAAEDQDDELVELVARRKRRRVESLAELERQLRADQRDAAPAIDNWAYAFSLFDAVPPAPSPADLPGLERALQEKLRSLGVKLND